MNAHQTPKPTHSETRRIPNVQIRTGDLVVVKSEQAITRGLAENVGQSAGGSWAEVIKAWHSAHGVISIVVKHDRAPHPTGLEQFNVLAASKTVTQSKL